jgi:menaquinone-dependent protoporphyrinogen IX oxidase
MTSLVIFGSRHGNTRKVAEAIAGELRKHGAVHLVPAESGPAIPLEQMDLVVIGGPTEAHRMTEPVVRFFDRIGGGALAGKAAAGFDTRLHCLVGCLVQPALASWSGFEGPERA